MFLLKNKLLLASVVVLVALVGIYSWMNGFSKPCRITAEKALDDVLVASAIPREKPLPREIAGKAEIMFRLLNQLYSERALYETEKVLGEGSRPDYFRFDLATEQEFKRWNMKSFTVEKSPETKQMLVTSMKEIFGSHLRRASVGTEMDKRRFKIRVAGMRRLFREENEALSDMFCFD